MLPLTAMAKLVLSTSMLWKIRTVRSDERKIVVCCTHCVFVSLFRLWAAHILEIFCMLARVCGLCVTAHIDNMLCASRRIVFPFPYRSDYPVSCYFLAIGYTRFDSVRMRLHVTYMRFHLGWMGFSGDFECSAILQRFLLSRLWHMFFCQKEAINLGIFMNIQGKCPFPWR